MRPWCAGRRLPPRPVSTTFNKLKMRTLELLAPAKDLACGLAAIDHGADAVYVGAEKFGARAAAGNSLSDIQRLTDYAHQFGAKVYVTVNTIVYEQELSASQQLITELARIGVDALLVQDMCTLAMRKVAMREVGHAPQLHASTQCDTRTAEKARWLRDLGFTRVVLARELSLDEIQAIHREVPDVELEVFVHGALCVSYSGVCYASQYCFQRSANRGECAQFCRMKFDLVDADGKVVEHDRHLLSLKDLCQIDHLEELADAGASSFKIEGRLKDAGYVKNVVSAYSRRLDDLVKRRPTDYRRASFGTVERHFEPSLRKTFNRGFTTYFLKGRQPDIASFDTPKALGEYVGKVKEVRRDSFNVAGTAAFANGDGLCYLTQDRELEGFRVNRAVGNRLYPFKMPQGLKPGTGLYRNNDVAFEKLLAGQTAERKIHIAMTFGLTHDGFSLRLCAPFLAEKAQVQVAFDHQLAKKSQGDNIVRQLSKLGATPYTSDDVAIADQADHYFIPSSLLSDLRREGVEALSALICKSTSQSGSAAAPAGSTPAMAQAWQPVYERHPYLFNISNSQARAFYEDHGLSVVHPAFEVNGGGGQAPLLMQCRHCIRYALGHCVRRGGSRPMWHEPLTLRLGDGRRFQLEFDCKACQMNVYGEK